MSRAVPAVVWRGLSLAVELGFYRRVTEEPRAVTFGEGYTSVRAMPAKRTVDVVDLSGWLNAKARRPSLTRSFTQPRSVWYQLSVLTSLEARHGCRVFTLFADGSVGGALGGL